MCKFAITFRPFVEKIGQYYWDQRDISGHFFAVHHPEETFSVLEPSVEGGCEKKVTSSVENTAVSYKQECILATNAGFFDIHDGSCLGRF